MKTMSKLLPAVVLMTFAACDNYVETSDFRKERNAREYREAMNEYQAGRLDEAARMLQGVCEVDPTNASARFQLACILQDHAKDYLSAYCAFREYLSQHPNSDKSRLAEDRLSTCEQELAKGLAQKYGLGISEAQTRKINELTEANRKALQQRQRDEKEYAELSHRYTSLEQENSRLKMLIRAQAEEDDRNVHADDIVEAKSLVMDEGDNDNSTDDAKRMLADGEGEPESPDAIKAAKALLDEDPDPVDAKPLIAQSPDAKQKRAAAEAAAKAKRAEDARLAAEKEASHEKRPDTYVVQDGDTLYKLAVRFYGHSSAWRVIREANKGVVSTDGRIRKGQTLVLPPLKK